MSLASVPPPAAAADSDAGPGDQISLAPRKRRRRRVVTPRQLPPPPPPIGVVRQLAGTTVIILSVVLLGFGLWLAFFSKLHYDRAQHVAYADFRAELAKALAPTGPTDPNANPDPNKPPVLLAPGSAVAVLTIPAIGLNTVVFQGTSPQVTEDGPGHLRDTPMPGQAGISVIMGRSTAFGGPFSKLATLAPGDAIIATAGQGVAKYTVIDLRRAGDPAPPPPEAGAGRLILATADGPPFAPTGVLWVDAQLTSKPFDEPAMILSAANLSPDENVLSADSTAWVPIVLWGQLLLGAAAAVGWLWRRWGAWQTWIVAVPVLGYLGVNVANEIARLLPNIM
jgi:sortase (surface protein transpeptidase)